MGDRRVQHRYRGAGSPHRLAARFTLAGTTQGQGVSDVALYLTGDRASDSLLTKDPFALLIGMVLDQQVPLERAFAAPNLLRDRLGGTLDVETIANMDPAKLADIFSERPA